MIDTSWEELLMEIAKLLQRQYNHMSEVYRLTEEISKQLQRDDRVSVQMLLGMRGEEIESVKECGRNLGLFKESAPAETKEWLVKALDGKGKPDNNESSGEAAVLRLADNVHTVWEKTMVIDRHMSAKLAGKDSYYTK